MPPAATVYTFEIDLSLIERGVFETLSLHVAQHPSETQEYLLTRVLAYCLEYTEGIEFTKGLQDADAPALWVHDLTGTLVSWIEIGAPSAERLHKASKKSPRVVIYTHKSPELVLSQMEGKRIQRAEEIMLHAIPKDFLADLVLSIEKRNKLELSASDGYLYLNIKGKSLQCKIETRSIA